MILMINLLFGVSLYQFLVSEQRIEWLKEGMIISLIGISVVFLGLTLLLGAMKLFLFFMNLQNRKTSVHAGDLIITAKKGAPITGEIVAAIAMAIHQNQQQYHDLEETILTLNRITRPYSPWSSKIHVLRKPAR